MVGEASVALGLGCVLGPSGTEAWEKGRLFLFFLFGVCFFCGVVCEVVLFFELCVLQASQFLKGGN